ncbi:hypothetical protein BC830DRAFT_143223 [Chytriomyces sp. MP71]|nr:hypothetical protein BC830DRAFT_143223 [Chytriomyces sp. MP71]
MTRAFCGVNNGDVDKRSKGNHYSPCLRCKEYLRRTDRDIEQHYDNKHPGEPITEPPRRLGARHPVLLQDIVAAMAEPVEASHHVRRSPFIQAPIRRRKRTEADRIRELESALLLAAQERDEAKLERGKAEEARAKAGRERDEALARLLGADAGGVLLRGRQREVDADAVAEALSRLAVAQNERDEAREALAQVQAEPILHWFKAAHSVELVGTMQLLAIAASHFVFSAFYAVLDTIQTNLLQYEMNALLLGLLGAYGRHMLHMIPRIFSKTEKLIMTVHNTTQFNLKLKGKGVGKPANTPFKGDIISMPSEILSNSTAIIEAFSPLEYNLWSFIGGVVYEVDGLQDQDSKPILFVIFVQATKQKVFTVLGPLDLDDVYQSFQGAYCHPAREGTVYSQWEDYQASAQGKSTHPDRILVTEFRLECV